MEIIEKNHSFFVEKQFKGSLNKIGETGGNCLK